MSIRWLAPGVAEKSNTEVLTLTEVTLDDDDVYSCRVAWDSDFIDDLSTIHITGSKSILLYMAHVLKS